MKVDSDSAYYLCGRYPFVIPVYQRNYSWTEKECRRLFNDLLHLMKNTSAHHFIGSICTKENRDFDGNRRIIIIDGQQRLTTLSLLFLALARTAEERKVGNLHDTIMSRYIFDDDKKRIPKLHLGLHDGEHYREVINNTDISNADNNIANNFKFFMKRLSTLSDIELSDLERSADRLDLAILSMDDDEDAQEIFDSINSTGIDLTDIDRIRNFLLMDLETDLQERLYLDYWVKIEDAIGYDNLIDFFCSYLVSYGSNKIGGMTLSKRVLYSIFKLWFNNIQEDVYKNKYDIKTEWVLNDIADSAIFYHDYIMTKTPDVYDQSNDTFWAINIIGRNQLMPMSVYIHKLLATDRISYNTMCTLMKICLTYQIRNSIVAGKNPFGYQQSGNVIARFMESTKNLDKISTDEASDYLFEALIISSHGDYRLVTDDELIESLKTQSFYNQSKDITKFVLYIIELNDKEARKGIPLYDTKTISIEHILPQTPDEWWINEFDADPDEYKHRIGNLTLTTLNSELGNKTFDEKKQKYEKDPFLVTRELCQFNEWTYEDINKRSLKIANKLIELFPIPKKYGTPEYQAQFELTKAIKSKRTTFHSLKIPVDSILTFIPNHMIKCVVADSINQVKYGNEICSISNLCKKLMMHNSKSSQYNGFDYFSYDGEKLTDRRKRMDAEKNAN